MHVLVPNWLDEFSRCKSYDEVLAVLTRAASALGFEYAAHGMRKPFPIHNRQTVMISNYPDTWRERYVHARYVEVDPVVRAALGSNEPVVWSAGSGLSAAEFWGEASSFGIVEGWSAASRGANGTVGLLTLSRSDDLISEAEQASYRGVVLWLAQTAHAVVAPFLPGGNVAGSPLTQREVDVLKWTADGKTAHEISMILSIAESTVNFHVKNIVAKLDVTNKIQAVAKAALTGLLR
ncbi:LuxR family transcriptional regulator [Burkholderia perseverans]|uniref:LuxR family transcriptional regulator n=1 Tax=Burkholderia perseverans TaxID=2615214 RepID=UPI001FEF69DD|nr:LuxR family transcriptional regulator [Burkholderia perseverans]